MCSKICVQKRNLTCWYQNLFIPDETWHVQYTDVSLHVPYGFNCKYLFIIKISCSHVTST